MKKLTLFSIALLFAACNNRGGTAGTGGTGVETTTPPHSDGLGVAITEFAELQQGGQATQDGEYDSQEGMFVPCGATQGQPVQPNQVRVIAGGSCDGMPNKLEPRNLMVVRRSGGRFNVVSRNVTLQDVTSEKGKGQYQTNEGAKQIVVDPETMKRLKAAPKILERVQRK